MDTKKLRQKILDLAIHGKLVPQDPNDEPASVLLERIRAEKEQLIKEGKIKAPKKSKTAGDTSHYPKDVPFEVPEGWVWCKIGDIADVARGGSPRPIDSYLTDNSSGVNWIKIGDAEQGGKYINSTRQRIKIEGVSRSRFVHSGDFLLTNSMSFGRPYILNVDGCIHDGWLVISPINNALYKDFFYYLLSSDYAYQQFSEQASGAVVSNLNKDKVAGALIPLPSVSEQKRIVDAVEKWLSILDLIDDGQSKLYELADDAKEKVLNLAIHGKLVPQDSTDEPAIELLKRIIPDFNASDNLHYEDGVKNGWLRCRVSDAFEINPKVTGNDEDECAFVPMALIPAGYSNRLRFERKKWATIKTGFTRFADGDIGVAKISPCLENRKSVIFNGLPSGIGAGTTELIIFRPILVVAEYGLLFFKSREFVSNCKGTYNGVVGQQRVDISVIRRMYIDIPPIPEQLKIVKTVKLLFRHLDSLQCSDALKL